ncbi:NAD(P)-dependent oxidoreductase [Streptomyces sp. NPDC089424]|uniref:NAD(P)-dependent oxidoreductase n=1 Tax=Streptomyces sp. NPDC089424 TaxID=3365917 RepID=UPI00382850A1
MADESRKLRVGFVGLGDIGEPMARRILLAGFPTTLWARRMAGLAPFDGSAYRRAVDLAELGRLSEVVGVCVFGEQDVSEVVLGESGILSGMSPGGVLVVHSTVTVDYVVELARRCAPHGVTVLDAPVAGFRQRAVSGQLTVMVGGPAEAFRRVRPVLDSFGSHVEHLGPVGHGLAMKGLNQALLLANVHSAVLALEAGRRLGMDPEATERMLRTATGGSFGMELLVGRILKDPRFAQLAAGIAGKDLSVFDELCRSAGLSGVELHDLAARGVEFMSGFSQESESL